MKHLITFEAYANTIPKAVGIEQETTLMDKDVDKKLTQEEIEELEEVEEKGEEKVKGKQIDSIKTKRR